MNKANKIDFFTKEDLGAVVKIENRCHLTPWTNKNFIDSYDAKNLFKVLKNAAPIYIRNKVAQTTKERLSQK